MTATLGQLIRDRRMELNLTQEELAERVGNGVRQSEISRLERNRVTLPRRHRMEQIAAALDIPVGVLLARSGWAGAETIEHPGSGADVDEGNDIEIVEIEPVAVTPETVEPVTSHQTDDAGEMAPIAATWSDPVPDDPAFPAMVESPRLHDAIERAESLIVESGSRMRQAQVTLDQARDSRRRRHESRTDPAGRMTPSS